ncbi:hypothetical protein PJ15_1139 [Acinetobacter sp. neg1]|nr:hypothetical protein PJ15_1139 [Acinetobacter sp. neg1]
MKIDAWLTCFRSRLNYFQSLKRMQDLVLAQYVQTVIVN